MPGVCKAQPLEKHPWTRDEALAVIKLLLWQEKSDNEHGTHELSIILGSAEYYREIDWLSAMNQKVMEG